MTDIEHNLPLWLQPAQIFTLHPDNKAQDEAQHGAGDTREIPFSGCPDHAANSFDYKINILTAAIRAATPWIAGLTASAMFFCILST